MKPSRFKQALPGIIIAVLAVLGMIDSTYLVVEYLAALATNGEPTPCSPNTLINCTKTVQGTWGHLLVAPNPLFGMLWYSGFALFGITSALGSTFSRGSRLFVGTVGIAGVAFSYILYLASVLALRGVCPFCLFSTTASTIVFLAFAVLETREKDSVLTPRHIRTIIAFQAFSFIAFVIGVPVFFAVYLPLLLNPWEAVVHWSFPVVLLIVGLMCAGHTWAFLELKTALAGKKRSWWPLFL